MGTLFAKVGTLWEPIVGNIDEVWIGTTDPYIATPAGTWEVWYNTTTTPGILNVRVAAAWVPVAEREIEITDIDPYVTNPLATTEVWYDTSPALEVPPEPNILKFRVAGAWQPLPIPQAEPPLDEVWVDSVSPDPAGTFQLWYDLSVDPPVLKAKMPNGAWVPVTTPLAFHNGASNLVPGVPSSGGTLDQPSRGDHIHEIPDPVTTQLGVTVENLRPGGPDTAGTAQTASRTDHAHGLPDWGPPTPGVTFDLPTQPGTDVAFSRADHQHGTPPAPPGAVMGTVATDVNPGTAAAPGTRNENSRTDHVHGMKAYGDVVAEREFGLLPVTGADETFARGDHRHGTPAHPLPANGLAAQVLTKSSATDYDAKWEFPNPSPSEVFIGAAAPTPPEELWIDTSVTPHVLKAYINNAYVPISSSTSEVEVGTSDPYTVDPTSVAELWYNNAANVKALFVRVSGAWVPANPNYGTVRPALSFGMQSNPGVLDEASRADHQHGTPPEPPGAALGSAATDVAPGVTAAGGTATEASRTDHTHGMKAYGDVVPEVTFGTLPRNGADDTFSRGDHAHGVPPNPLPAGGLTNQVLTKSSVADYDAKWETAAAGGVNEVVISTTEPTDSAVELWYDTDEVAATTEEVFVGPAEPPDPSIELWYDSDAVPVVPVHGMRAFWEPTVTYMPDNQVLWPKEGADVWMALRETVNETPGVTGINDGVDFSDRGAAPTVPQGFSALLPGVDFLSGVDIRYHTGKYAWGTQWLGGTLVSATNAGNIPVFSVNTVVDADPLLNKVVFSVLDINAVHYSAEVLISALDTLNRAFLRFTIEAANRTLNIYDSEDGVTWTLVSGPSVSPEVLLLSGVTAVHIGHDNDEPTHNWGGPQSEVEIYNFAGVLQSSWVAFTQPSNPDGPNYPDPAPDPVPQAGVGVSPKTGEEYFAVGAVGSTWMVDRYPAWTNVSGMVHWTNDFSYAGTQGKDGYGIAFNSGAAIYKRGGGGIVIREHSGGTQPAIENFDGTARRDIIDTTNGDARYARLSTFVMRQQTSLAITAGQYYYIGAVQNSGGADVIRISITAKSGNSIQAFDAVQNVNLNGQFGWTALLSPSASTGTKLFDRLGAYWHSAGARMKLRAVATATINIGWTAYNTMNGAAFGGSTWVHDTTGGTETGAVAL